MDETSNIMDKVQEAAGVEFDARIEDNIMLISPAEAGIVLFATVAKSQEEEDKAWSEVDRISTALEEARISNAELRDLFEDVYPVLVELGQDELAAKMMEVFYPIRGIDGGAA